MSWVDSCCQGERAESCGLTPGGEMAKCRGQTPAATGREPSVVGGLPLLEERAECCKWTPAAKGEGTECSE